MVVLIYVVFASDKKITSFLNFQDWLMNIIWWQVTKLKKLVHRQAKPRSRKLYKNFLLNKRPNYHIAEPVFFSFYWKRKSIDRSVNTLSLINCGCWKETWKLNWRLLFLWAVGLPYVVIQRWCNENCSKIKVEELSFERCVTVWTSTRYFQDYCRLRSLSMVLQMERERSIWRYI